MKNNEAADRYAKALYALATESDRIDSSLNELREFTKAVEKDSDLNHFFNAPVVKAEEQKDALKKFFEKKAFSDEVQSLLLLLAEKRRFTLLPEICSSFQTEVDKSRGVTRGHVRSAATLFPEDRLQLETTISRYTGKKAVLEYQEDKSLLGGLVAHVGSFTFDDSLETQLRLMNDALTKRRAH